MSKPVNQGSKLDGMKRYAIPGLPLAETGIFIISWLGLEWLIFPYWHLFFPNSSPASDEGWWNSSISSLVPSKFLFYLTSVWVFIQLTFEYLIIFHNLKKTWVDQFYYITLHYFTTPLTPKVTSGASTNPIRIMNLERAFSMDQRDHWMRTLYRYNWLKIRN